MTSRREGDTIKSYHRRKLGTGVLSSVFVFLLLLALVLSGLSRTLDELSRTVSDYPAGSLLVFAVTVGGLQTLLAFPFRLLFGVCA